MKYFFFIVLLFFVFSCTKNMEVYWCGDHACINNKEKESYFKKTMTVEIKNLGNNNKKAIPESDLLKQQNIIKEKSTIKDDKKLAKKIRIEKKVEIREQKELEKQLRVEEKKRIKEEKKSAKAKKKSSHKIKKNTELNKIEEIIATNTNTLSSDVSEFETFVEKITKKNKFRPYPDINDIPN